MAVPAHDQRDWEFANTFELPVKQVISPSNSSELDAEKARLEKEAIVEYGNLINSDNETTGAKFNGLSTEEAKKEIVSWGEKQGFSKTKVNYRLRDWLISHKDTGEHLFLY